MEQICYSYEDNNPFDRPLVSHKFRLTRIDRIEIIVGKVADTVDSVIDSVDQLSNQLGRMSLNEQSQKPFYCSNYEQEEHKKNNCPNLAFAPSANPVAKSNFTRCYPQLPFT